MRYSDFKLFWKRGAEFASPPPLAYLSHLVECFLLLLVVTFALMLHVFCWNFLYCLYYVLAITIITVIVICSCHCFFIADSTSGNVFISILSKYLNFLGQVSQSHVLRLYLLFLLFTIIHIHYCTYHKIEITCINILYKYKSMYMYLNV